MQHVETDPMTIFNSSTVRKFYLALTKHVIETEFERDEERARRIAERLLDQFYNQKGFFKDYSMPEYVLPRNLVNGSREHALYLTYVISIDYMTDAKELWANARGAYELNPERFEPNNIVRLDERTLQPFLRRLGARYPKSAVETWRKISKILLDLYGGDPRNITAAETSIEELRTRMSAFPYLRGEKLFNFYLRAMGENGLLKISDFSELDIPVDVQVARFTLYTGTLRILTEVFQGCVHRDPLRSLIQGVWREAAKQTNTYPWKLDEPIWSIGSSLCSKRRCGLCPVEDLCDKTRGFKFKDGDLVWKKLAVFQADKGCERIV